MAEIEQEISEVVNSLLKGKPRINLLEGGCGSATHIHFDSDVHAVGIDISSESLARNTAVQEKILGDIQEYPLPKEEYDVVICWNVIEHLPRPKQALLNLSGAVKPQGVLILGFPNLLSIKGIITRFTPYWFHVYYYKRLNYKNRPFPTYLKADIVPSRVERFALDHGFSVEFFKVVEGRNTRKARGRSRFVNCAFLAVNALTIVLSFGKLRSPLLDNCGMVLVKRGAA